MIEVPKVYNSKKKKGFGVIRLNLRRNHYNLC